MSSGLASSASREQGCPRGCSCLVTICSARRLKVEELEGERSRLEESKKQLETQLERLTLLVSVGCRCPPGFLLPSQGCGSPTHSQGPPPTHTPLPGLPRACPKSHREDTLPPAPEPQPVCVHGPAVGRMLVGWPAEEQGFQCGSGLASEPIPHNQGHGIRLLLTLFNFTLFFVFILLSKSFHGRKPTGLRSPRFWTGH